MKMDVVRRHHASVISALILIQAEHFMMKPRVQRLKDKNLNLCESAKNAFYFRKFVLLGF